MDKENFPGPIQILKTTAKEWEKKYDDDNTVGDAKSKMKAFLIPRESLEKVLALDTTAVRAYLGINELNEKVLFFVGAEKDEKTGQYLDVFGTEETEGKSAEAYEDVAYDGVRPSPPY